MIIHFMSSLVKPLKLLLCPLLILCLTDVARSEPPTLADVAKIYNIEKKENQKIDVRYYRKGECDEKTWCPIKGAGDYLKKKDYLQTGNVSRADLALMNASQQRYTEVLFWQQEGSRSKFVPQAGTCHFQVEFGGFLYAYPHQGGDLGCDKIVSKNATIMPHGATVFIVGSLHSTQVGVLSTPPNASVTVQPQSHGGASITLETGEYAQINDDGALLVAPFDLADFYSQYPLSLGLGPDTKDEDYIKKQSPEIQKILNKARAKTLEALREQSYPVQALNFPVADSPVVRFPNNLSPSPMPSPMPSPIPCGDTALKR